jgi:hypothetical protein
MSYRSIVPLATAGAFASATAWGIWRLEYFDVFRWGIPRPGILMVYAAYIAAAGALGWGLARFLTSPRLWS